MSWQASIVFTRSRVVCPIRRGVFVLSVRSHADMEGYVKLGKPTIGSAVALEISTIARYTKSYDREIDSLGHTSEAFSNESSARDADWKFDSTGTTREYVVNTLGTRSDKGRFVSYDGPTVQEPEHDEPFSSAILEASGSDAADVVKRAVQVLMEVATGRVDKLNVENYSRRRKDSSTYKKNWPQAGTQEDAEFGRKVKTEKEIAQAKAKQQEEAAKQHRYTNGEDVLFPRGSMDDIREVSRREDEIRREYDKANEKKRIGDTNLGCGGGKAGGLVDSVPESNAFSTPSRESNAHSSRSDSTRHLDFVPKSEKGDGDDRSC